MYPKIYEVYDLFRDCADNYKSDSFFTQETFEKYVKRRFTETYPEYPVNLYWDLIECGSVTAMKVMATKRPNDNNRYPYILSSGLVWIGITDYFLPEFFKKYPEYYDRKSDKSHMFKEECLAKSFKTGVDI